MSISLPNSPVRKIFDCPKCGTVSIKFYDSKHDRTYSQSEWEVIVTEGEAVLYRLLQTVREDPKFFA